MTRAVSITDTICIECGVNYDTVEEAIECETLDRAEREAEEDEYLADLEQGYWEDHDDYLTSLYGVDFTRP